MIKCPLYDLEVGFVLRQTYVVNTCHLTQAALNSERDNCQNTCVSCSDDFHTWVRCVQTDCKLPELAFNTTLIAVQVGGEEGDPR